MKRQENNADVLLPGNYLAILLDLLSAKNINTAPLLNQCKIKSQQLQKHDVKIPSSQFTEFLTLAHEKVSNTEFWFEYGSSLTIAAHGSVGQALMSCENLKQTVNLLIRYYQIQFPLLDLSYDFDDAYCIVQLNRFEEDIEEEEEIERENFGAEIFFTTLHNNIRQLVNRPDLVITFHFDKPQPSESVLNIYHNYLGENVAFDKPFPQLRLPIEYLDLPITFSNPVMQKFYVQHCEQLLQEMEAKDDIVNQVRQHILATPGEFPNLDQVAEKMNVSIRTLRRKLDQHDTSFQSILNTIREQIATKYLQTTHLTVEQIAQLVGYSDTSNFRRAFQKWTGTTPSAYRRSTQK